MVDNMDLEEINLVRSDTDAVLWLTEMTGCYKKHAVEALDQANGDISDAIDILPTIQNATTDAEIRKLVESADARTFSIEVSNADVSSTSHDVTRSLTKPDVIVIEDDADSNTNNRLVADSNSSAVTAHDSNNSGVFDSLVTDSKNSAVTDSNNSAVFDKLVAKTGVSTDSAVFDKLVAKTGVSTDRVTAALKLAGNDEDAALDIINRHNLQHRKRKRSEEPAAIVPTSTTGSTTEAITEKKEIVLMCWNIDGLCEKGLSERFSAVISNIKNTRPHVVMLQEVVGEHVARIRSQLGLSYDVTFGDRAVAYYNVILINKSRGGSKVLQKKVRKFPCSIMGRHFVQVDCELFGREFSFYTSHLESMKEHSKERTSQLNKVLEQMRSSNVEHITIFGGDTNLRDFEMTRVSLLNNFYDVWERLGRDATTKHTWDTTLNKNTQAKYNCKLRFDRLIVRDSPFCTPTSFTLIGKTLLTSCEMFPSDHWGMLAHFQIT